MPICETHVRGDVEAGTSAEICFHFHPIPCKPMGVSFKLIHANAIMRAKCMNMLSAEKHYAHSRNENALFTMAQRFPKSST